MKARQCIHIFPTVVIVGDEYFKRDGRWEETPDIYTALLVCATGRQRRNSWLEVIG